MPSYAQVTIGDGVPPQNFSVLEISTAGTKGGLRLPHLTTAERNAWRDYFLGTATTNPANPTGSSNVTADESLNAPGLAIFNTDTKCYEYWNASRWVSLCEGNSLMVISPDPCQNVAADGTGCDDEFTVTDPDCLNGPFTIIIVAGQDYATLTDVNEADGIFRIAFQPNNSISQRSVVVRVTSSCTGLYKDFLFLQDGHACDTTLGTAPEITSVPPGKNIAFCTGGAVYLSIDETQITAPGTLADVIWTRNNIEVARSVNNLVVTQEGKYDVWMGYIGCNLRANNAVTVTKSGTGAPQPVSIVVNGNNGMVCGPAGTTKLVALNPNSGGTVLWFKNGILQDGTNGTDNITGTEVTVGIGNWFAVVQDATCYSRPSETVAVIENPNSGGSLTEPVIDKGGTFCAGSSILLSVSGGSYNAAYTYTWYENNTQIGMGSSVMYTVPSGVTSVVIRCRATQPGSCAQEALAVETITIGTIPARPVITGNTVLCSGTATLNVIPSGSGSFTYAWYKDNALIGTTQTITVTSGGDYYATVTDGCTSPMAHRNLPYLTSATPTVTLDRSNVNPNLNDIVTYAASIDFTPATGYNWIITNATLQSGGGNTPNAVVMFDNTGAAEVRVEVTNACGTGVNSHEITDVQPFCATITNVFPNTLTEKSTVAGTGTTLGLVSATFSSGSPTPKYQWYSNSSNSNTGGTAISGANTGTYIASSTSPDTYYYYCVVSVDGCPGTMASGVYKVTVSENPATMDRGAGTLRGKTCFDINKSNWTTDCGPQSARETVATDFATLGPVTYTFTAAASGTKSNLRFVVVDTEGCVVSYSGGKTGTIANNEVINLTVNYKTTLSEVTDIIYGRTRDQAALVTIYAIYNDGTKDVSVPLLVKIQDCVCCGAFVASGQWKAFMCHNLGADEGLDAYTPAKGLNGDYYQWGRSTVVATVDTPAGAIAGWNTTYAPNGSWSDASKTANDPCPPNYRLPKNSEWTGVINTSLNPQTIPPGATWNTSETNFSSGRKFGPALYLPAAGYRNPSNGQLNDRGSNGSYWSSTELSSNIAYGMSLYSSGASTGYNGPNRTYGSSVRCIAE
ncbi:hypothetical protein JCM30204_22020 [Dysgonomonas termitidis]